MKTYLDDEENKDIISEYRILYLTLNDQELLLKHLSNPVKPNLSMKNTLDIYEKYLSFCK